MLLPPNTERFAMSKLFLAASWVPGPKFGCQLMIEGNFALLFAVRL